MRSEIAGRAIRNYRSRANCAPIARQMKSCNYGAICSYGLTIASWVSDDENGAERLQCDLHGDAISYDTNRRRLGTEESERTS